MTTTRPTRKRVVPNELMPVMAAATTDFAPAPDTQFPVQNVMETKGLRVAYSGREVLHGIDLPVARGMVTAMVGPSGCGKTTLLRTLNRLSELTPGCVASGSITIDGEESMAM